MIFIFSCHDIFIPLCVFLTILPNYPPNTLAFVHTHMHTHIRTPMFTYTHTQVHEQSYRDMHTGDHVHAHMRVHINSHTCIHTHICSHIRLYKCICMDISACTEAHSCLFIGLQTYMHGNIHVHRIFNPQHLFSQLWEKYWEGGAVMETTRWCSFNNKSSTVCLRAWSLGRQWRIHFPSSWHRNSVQCM